MEPAARVVPGVRWLLAASGDGSRPPLVHADSAYGWGPAPQAPAADKRPQATTKRGKKVSTSGRASRGWGPFRSVLKERSVDFNLTLDVQAVRQEIQNLVTLRELLRTKALVQRHSHDGSLVKLACEFYRVFRAGFEVGDGRKRSICERDQRQYLFSAMDERVDVGNGLFGPEVMAQQLQIYSTFIRYLNLSLETFELITADESVVVATRGAFRFQVLRNTIQQIFPHVMNNEALVARLVGRQIDTLASLTFYFNAEGKCARYEVDIDFMAAFAAIVTDPYDLELLFGDALIAENCMFGVLESSQASPALLDAPDELQAAPRSGASHFVAPVLDSEYGAAQRGYDDYPDGSGSNMAAVAACVSPRDAPSAVVAWRLVRMYFSVYSRPHPTDRQNEHVTEERFIEDYCAPNAGFMSVDGWVGLKKRWSDLRRSFDVIDFRLVHEDSCSYDARLHAYRVDTVAVYVLGITLRTVELVFPHVATRPSLAAALMHRAVYVESQLTFWVSGTTGKLQRVAERMDFAFALRELVAHPGDVAFVLDHALITTEGALAASRTEKAIRQ